MDFSGTTFSGLKMGVPYDKLKIIGVCSTCRITIKKKLKKKQLYPLRLYGDCPCCKVKCSITRCYGEICELCSRMRQQCCVCKAPYNEYGIRNPVRLLSDKQTMTELRYFKESNTRMYLATLFDLYHTYTSASIPATILPQLRTQLSTLYCQLRADECISSGYSGPHLAFANPFDDDDSDNNSDEDQLSYAGI